MIKSTSLHGKTLKVTTCIEVEQAVPKELAGDGTTNHNLGSVRIPTIRDLRTVDPAKAFYQKGDLEVVEDHILNRIDSVTPNGLVATWVALDVFGRTFAEYISTPGGSIDPYEMADRIVDLVLDALDDEFGEGSL